jgi:hypothetical protein
LQSRESKTAKRQTIPLRENKSLRVPQNSGFYTRALEQAFTFLFTGFVYMNGGNKKARGTGSPRFCVLSMACRQTMAFSAWIRPRI